MNYARCILLAGLVIPPISSRLVAQDINPSAPMPKPDQPQAPPEGTKRSPDQLPVMKSNDTPLQAEPSPYPYKQILRNAIKSWRELIEAITTNKWGEVKRLLTGTPRPKGRVFDFSIPPSRNSVDPVAPKPERLLKDLLPPRDLSAELNSNIRKSKQVRENVEKVLERNRQIDNSERDGRDLFFMLLVLFALLLAGAWAIGRYRRRKR